MQLVLKDSASFKKCVDAIAVLIDEAEFLIDSKGLSLKATDPSQISMIDFHLPKSAFQEFTVEQPTKVGLDLDYFSQIMSRASSNESIKLALDHENARLMLTFKGNSTRHFSVPLIDVSAAELPTPKIDFDATVKIKGDALQGGLKDAALISSHITVGVDALHFFLRANSSKGELNHETEKKDLMELNAKKECSAMYPLDYLQDMLKVADSNTIVSLQLKANAPIQLSYSVGEAQLSYFLAPRIENA